MGPIIGDASWVRQAFIVEQSSLDAVDQQNRVFSTASIKFTDTTLGGNLSINPLPQFCRFADIRPENRSRAVGSSGMGRYYSEAIDDQAQIIYMRMGLPAFNSLTNFFTNFYNYEMGQLARTGRSTGILYAIGRVGAFVASLLSWKVMAVHMIGISTALMSTLAQKTQSKFYYSKPAMPLYWNAVQTIVNQIAVNKGIVPRAVGGDSQNYQQSALNDQYQFTKDDVTRLHAAFPEMFSESGSIDVYALANRAQRMARRQEAYYRNLMDSAGSGADIGKQIQQIYTQQMSNSGMDYLSYLQAWLDTTGSQSKAGAPTDTSSTSASAVVQATTADPGATPAAPNPADTTTESIFDVLDPSKQKTDFFEFLKAEWDDGSAFASFRVDATGPVSESFSSTVGESEISSKLNSLSSSGRNMQFNFANGNIGGGALGSLVGGVASAVKDLTMGALDQLKLSGLAALSGSAFVDIPKHWQSSVAQLPHSSYTIQLRSPYGNPISQMMNLYVPLAMLLATALPLSTGKQSYTSPFLVELYDKGRCMTRLGMVESMQITRGQGNTGWHSDGYALGIDVTFSIVDMSSVLHMPISAGFNYTTGLNIVGDAVTAGVVGTVVGGPAAGGVAAVAAAAQAAGVFDEDTVFTDYMNVLGSMGLADAVYPLRRFKRNLTQKLTAFQSWKSVSHMASFAGDMLPSRIISAFYRGTVR